MAKSKAQKRMEKKAQEFKTRMTETPKVSVDGRWRKIGDLKSKKVLHEFSQWKNRDLFDLYFLVQDEIVKILETSPREDYFKCVEMIESKKIECVRDIKYQGTDAQAFSDIVNEMFINKEDKIWANIEIKNNGKSANFSTFIMKDGNINFMEDWAILGGKIYRANYSAGEGIPDSLKWMKEKKIAM